MANRKKTALERYGVEGLAKEFVKEAERMEAEANAQLHLAKSYREAADRLRKGDKDA